MQVKVDTRELKQVARRLGQTSGSRVGSEARAALARAARPVQSRIQAAARVVEVGSSKDGAAPPVGHTDLRRRVAEAVELSVNAGGVAFYVAGYRIGVKGTKLAQLLDTEDRPRWRHPVFGNRRVWAEQTGQPFFYVTIRAAEPEFEAAVDAAMTKASQEIMR